MYYSMFVLAAIAVAADATGDHNSNNNLRHLSGGVHHRGGGGGDDGWQVASQQRKVATTGHHDHVQVQEQAKDDIEIVIQGHDETVTIVQENDKEVIIIQNTKPASGVLTESDITVSQTTEIRDLITYSRSRPMNSTGGVTYTFDPNLSFTDTYYFKDSKAIVWDPNTINSLVDDILLNDDNPSWPSIVQSTFNADLTEVQTVTITYQTTPTNGQALFDALTSKRQELMTSSQYQLGSPIIDTTGSRYVYKTTTDLDNGQTTGPSMQYSGYAWILCNTTGFFSGELTIRFDEVSSSDYKVYYYEDDTSNIAIEYVYMDDIWPNRQITEQVVYDTIHATQLLEFLQTKFY